MTASPRLAAAAAALCLWAQAATAQERQPLQPGLWLLQMQPADPAAATRLQVLQGRLKDAPPQWRAMAESLLQQQGMSLAGADSVRMCLSARELESGGWQGPLRGAGCSTTLLPGDGGTGLRFHTHCASPVPSDTEGEARFLDPRHYTINATSTVSTSQGTRTLRLSGSAQWLSADCAGLGR